MIQKLQIKIIAVVLGTLLIVFAAVLLVLNLSVARTSAQRAENFMSTIIENDGFFFTRLNPYDFEGVRVFPIPENDMPMSAVRIISPFEGSQQEMQFRFRTHFIPSEMSRAGRFFYVRTDFDGTVIEENLQFVFGLENAANYIELARYSGRTRGNIGNFSFMTAEKPYGQMLVFIERSIDMLLISRLNQISLWVAGIVSLILFFLSVFLSRWIVAPVKNSFEKQRRFISDASHELKTPLTIISANADVLRNEMGENQRLSHIKIQSERMNGLVHDMLTLAKADEGQISIVRGKFDISAAIFNTVLEFESRAFEEEKNYSYDIKENIEYIGDEKQIKQLAAVLIDNALQYSGASGDIKVTLNADIRGSRNFYQNSFEVSASAQPPVGAKSEFLFAPSYNSQILLSVYNTGTGVPDNEQKKIFERFYRTDESRSRETGGYGVGLSIAKAITDSHKGKISVTGEYKKWIKFDVIL